MKIFSKIFLLCITIICFFSCNSESGIYDNSNIDFSPQDVVGKEFKFYKGENDEFSFKVVMGETANRALILTSSQLATTSDCNAWYTKAGKHNAIFECYFKTMFILGGEGIFQWNQYKLNLNFLSNNHGYFTGVKMKNPMDESGETFTGRFIYDSDKLPTDINWEENFIENINYKFLIGSTWYHTENDSHRYIKFDDDNTYKQYIKIGEELEEKSIGTYEINKWENSVTLKPSSNNYNEFFKIKELTANTMTVLIPDIEGNYSNENTLSYKKIDDKEAPSFITVNENLEISEPIVEDITENSALIKGTIIGENVTFITRGIQYSTDSEMKIGLETFASRNEDGIIKINLNNLHEGTTYYVRLYAKTENNESYSNIISFTTLGTKVENIILTQKGIFNTALVIDAKLPNDITKYGICYSRNPNPKITDSYKKEETRCKRWVLYGLEKATTYYVRPYHIEGSKVIYYEECEVALETLGNNTKLDCSLDVSSIVYNYENFWDAILMNPKVNITWENFASGTYLLDCTVYAGNLGQFNGEKYIDSENGYGYIPGSRLWFSKVGNANQAIVWTYVKDLNGNLMTVQITQYNFNNKTETHSILQRTAIEEDEIKKYIKEGKI